ncbi:MAG: Jag N-terminal domain-containing protein [Endomicrobiaceae bacterium]|jgi:spoIIIJ-associated protein|nr:Jag N-terminal domain-containing protein [Endomicrobiaceae bacterium]
MKLKELESTGKNISEAINTGLKLLKCTKDEVEVKILDEGSSGLFGLMGSKPARVLLTLKNGIAEIKNIETIDFKLACKSVENVINDIVKMMGINISSVKTSHEDDTVSAEIASDNSGVLIGKGGQSLDALEYLVQLIVNTDPRTRVKVNLDTENYRAKQQERLKTIAEKAMEYVRRTKKIYRFDPMSAKERRYLHNYLKNIGGFDTFSEGEGVMRKVGVKLANEKK